MSSPEACVSAASEPASAEPINARDIQRGVRYRRLADGLTYGRTVAMAVVAANTAFNDRIVPGLKTPSLLSATVVAGLSVFDKADGMAARKAESLGIPITDKDKKKDPLHDKIFAHSMMAAFTVRAVREKQYTLAAVIAGNQITTAVRDREMTKSRKNAVPGAEVSAIPVNKYKTGVQGVAHTLAASPLNESVGGRTIISTIYTLSTAMGLYGLKEARKMHNTSQELPKI